MYNTSLSLTVADVDNGNPLLYSIVTVRIVDTFLSIQKIHNDKLTGYRR